MGKGGMGKGGMGKGGYRGRGGEGREGRKGRSRRCMDRGRGRKGWDLEGGLAQYLSGASST